MSSIALVREWACPMYRLPRVGILVLLGLQVAWFLQTPLLAGQQTDVPDA